MKYRNYEAIHSWTYYKNELLRGGNFPLYKVNPNQSLTPLGLSINEKFVESLKGRIEAKEAKMNELETKLKTIRAECHQQFQDLKYKNSKL